MGILLRNGKTSHRWDVLPYMGRLPIHGKSSHVWEVFPYIGRLPRYGKSFIGRLPTYGESPHTWEVFPYKESEGVPVGSWIGVPRDIGESMGVKISGTFPRGTFQASHENSRPHKKIRQGCVLCHKFKNNFLFTRFRHCKFHALQGQSGGLRVVYSDSA